MSWIDYVCPSPPVNYWLAVLEQCEDDTLLCAQVFLRLEEAIAKDHVVMPEGFQAEFEELRLDLRQRLPQLLERKRSEIAEIIMRQEGTIPPALSRMLQKPPLPPLSADDGWELEKD